MYTKENMSIPVGIPKTQSPYQNHRICKSAFGPLFNPQTVAWLRAESNRYRLDNNDADSLRFARMLSLYRHSRYAFIADT